MRVPEDFGTPQTEHNVPPFWIGASPNGGAPIDQRVLDVAAEAWPWCYRTSNDAFTMEQAPPKCSNLQPSRFQTGSAKILK